MLDCCNVVFFCLFQVRPKVQLQTLLKDAGADKDVFTMKEVGRWHMQGKGCLYLSFFCYT